VDRAPALLGRRAQLVNVGLLVGALVQSPSPCGEATSLAMGRRQLLP
jgi:hypothetical protein